MEKLTFPFTPEELQTLGFEELNGDKLDDGDYYRWWRKKFGDLELDITYSFNQDHQPIELCVELGGNELRKNITREDILQLGRILQDNINN